MNEHDQCTCTTTQPKTALEHNVQRALLPNVVVSQGAAALQLSSTVDDRNLAARDPFFVLDLLLHGLDRVRRLHIERNGLARQRFD